MIRFVPELMKDNPEERTHHVPVAIRVRVHGQKIDERIASELRDYNRPVLIGHWWFLGVQLILNRFGHPSNAVA